MRIAVIPARGGSKRIPRKNIRLFGGRPMIAWSIEAALASELFDQVIVSTDDEEIATIAIEEGATVPFLRPAELADDYTPTKPVVSHALRHVQSAEGALVSHACCIYPTAPFLQPDDLKKGWQAIEEGGFRYAFAASSYPYPIQRALRQMPSGGVEMLYPEYRTTRSQDLEEAWHDAGQFYFGDSLAFIEELPVFASHSMPIALPRWRVHDIDTPEDWLTAEVAFRALFDGRRPE
ncbi:pseudaminic acid cytidylyltransferase [Brevundimonas intermedia]|uniref:Pseudaminic acid cytidylyltransferase n=1 Tax=Brevundimonas intermedia TaxID=74315 RepID=A0A4Y9RXD5_9CAUL|nr:pseudaminic acid cytidylyltransferase [Brevundimonas intermedia]TFW13553.1 pseudaminic acid cytidylyltransferase [Brevundimonas intermedia]